MTGIATIEPNVQESERAGEYFWVGPWTDAAMVGVGAVTIRGLICFLALVISGASVGRYAELFDGRSYLITARAMNGDWTNFDEYQGRVFPGFPAGIAGLNRIGISPAVAGVGLNWLLAGVAAGAVVVLFGDVRVGAATAVLMPHFLMNSSLALSEAPMLGLCCAGLAVLWGGEGKFWRVVVGGVLLGMAGTVRPMAVFAAVGFAVVAVERRQWRELFIVIVVSCAVVFFTMWRVQVWRGDSLASVRYYANSHLTYDGNLLTWPFHSLLAVTFSGTVSVGRSIYIWVHVAVILFACAIAVQSFVKRRAIDLLAGSWLISNTLFVLCIGSVWGFECFHRFAVPAWPAACWSLRGFLPRRRCWWIVIAGVSGGIAIFTIVGALAR